MDLLDYRKRWHAKPSLRIIYNQYFDIILKSCIKGSILEIGGGSGNFKERAPEMISVDIQAAAWLDAVIDAQSLPYANGSFDNIVMIDVLHHLEYPVRFLSEAVRILHDRGRLIMLEPAITPISTIFYRLFHEERVDMRIDPFHDGQPDSQRMPFEANQAIPTLMFLKKQDLFIKKFPCFQLVKIRYYSMFAYPLSGGFKSWCLIPEIFVKPLLRIEDFILPFVGKFLAFRMFVILEKRYT